MPPQPDTLAHGRELQQAGDSRQAEEVYRRLLRGDPKNAEVWYALGQLCAAENRLAEAVASHRQATELEPRAADGHLQVGNVLLRMGNYAEAEKAFRRCLELEPGNVTALGNLGYSLGEMERLDEAKACYEQALRQRHDLPEVHHNLGNVLREQGQLDGALACYDQAIRLRPEYGKAYVNRGIALVAQARIDEALRSLQRGVQLLPDLADAHNSLGTALFVAQRFDEAMARYEHALRLNPQHAETAWNMSLTWLLQGDYERGWPAYEWRWKCRRTIPHPAFTQPRWDGGSLDGKTILLYGEQGLGDTLHFARYAALVKARGAGRVIVMCQNALMRLLARTPGIDGLVGWGATPPAFDVWAPFMSLPALFGTTLASIPADVPYVFPDPELVAHWKRQLAPARGFRIGIAWQGSPRHAWDRHRSAGLDAFEPLARIQGVQLISLQKGPGSEQLRALAGRFPVLSLGELLDEGSGPFMDTSAIVANLDLVICVDSALAHLVGAMGVPAWLALTFTPDWRWLLGRADSLWYPTLKLFRQPRLGDWRAVFAEIAENLRQEVVRRPVRRSLLIEVSPAELLDRIVCRETRLERATEPRERQALETELARLRIELSERSADLAGLETELRAVHARLWQLEEALRECEQSGDFGPRYVELTRSLTQENKRRPQR
jgi:tetratricopeptide (TPR) repeat protein